MDVWVAIVGFLAVIGLAYVVLVIGLPDEGEQLMREWEQPFPDDEGDAA